MPCNCCSSVMHMLTRSYRALPALIIRSLHFCIARAVLMLTTWCSYSAFRVLQNPADGIICLLLGLSLIRNIYRFDNRQNYYRYATSIRFSESNSKWMKTSNVLMRNGRSSHVGWFFDLLIKALTHTQLSVWIQGQMEWTHSCSGNFMCCSSCVFLKNLFT